MLRYEFERYIILPCLLLLSLVYLFPTSFCCVMCMVTLAYLSPPKVCITVLEMLTTIFAVVYKGYTSLVVNV